MIGHEHLRSLLCATRGSASIVKAGYHGSGTRQYLCKVCGAHRVLQAKGPAIEPEREALILRAGGVERLSLRAAQHVFGVARPTIAKCLEKKPPVSRR